MGGLTAVIGLVDNSFDNSFAGSHVSEEPVELRSGVVGDARHDVGVHVECDLRMRMAELLIPR